MVRMVARVQRVRRRVVAEAQQVGWGQMLQEAGFEIFQAQ
jgi:hypothetical protein